MNPFTLNPLQIKLALVGIALTAIALLSLTTWALIERSGRLECKVELVQAQDQTKVLAHALTEQTKSIDNLAAISGQIRANTGRSLLLIEQQHAGTRAQVAGLEALIKQGASTKSCSDYLKEWRAEP